MKENLIDGLDGKDEEVVQVELDNKERIRY